MSHSLWQNISIHIVDQAVAQTFQMLTESDAEPTTDSLSTGSDVIAMAVYCDEAQQSAVLIRLSRPLARMLTSRMLEIPDDALADEDVQDATGELVNVIAGSLRGLMDSPGAMSTPFMVKQEELSAISLLDKRTYLVEDELLQLFRV